MRHTAADRTPTLRKGNDFRDLASIQQSFQIPEETELFPVIRSTTHMKVMLPGSTQKSKHFLLMSLSYFPQELAFSPKARPRSHLDNCIIIFCLPKGPHILLNTIKSRDLLNGGWCHIRAWGLCAHHPTFRGVMEHKQTPSISRRASGIRNSNTAYSTPFVSN